MMQSNHQRRDRTLAYALVLLLVLCQGLPARPLPADWTQLVEDDVVKQMLLDMANKSLDFCILFTSLSTGYQTIPNIDWKSMVTPKENGQMLRGMCCNRIQLVDTISKNGLTFCERYVREDYEKWYRNHPVRNLLDSICEPYDGECKPKEGDDEENSSFWTQVSSKLNVF